MALPSKFQSSPIVNSPRKLNLFVRFSRLNTLAWTMSAWMTYRLPWTMASMALCPHYHDSLVESHVSRALARVALLRFTTRLCSWPFANATGASPFDLYDLCSVYSTLVVPFTDSLKSKSYLIEISSRYYSVLFTLFLPLFPPWFEKPPPKRSSNIDSKSAMFGFWPPRLLAKPPLLNWLKKSSFSKPE